MARGADVVCGTCADATRHTKPRGRAMRAHAARRCTQVARRFAQVARKRGRGHVSPRGRPGGATW